VESAEHYLIPMDEDCEIEDAYHQENQEIEGDQEMLENLSSKREPTETYSVKNT
jgi:hypothetical protein